MWRFRRKNRVDVYLPGAYGSAEFRAAYEAALEGAKAPVTQTTALYGTLAWLIEQYLRSPKYLNLSDVRKSSIRRELDWLRAKAGKYHIGALAARHVEALMGLKAGQLQRTRSRKTCPCCSPLRSSTT